VLFPTPMGIATVEESTGECVFITVVVSIPIAPTWLWEIHHVVIWLIQLVLMNTLPFVFSC